MILRFSFSLFCLTLITSTSPNIKSVMIENELDNLTSTLIKPPHLKKGDTVAIVAPSGFLRDSESGNIERAKELLKKWGLKVVLGKNLYQKNHHFAGTDAQRLEDLQSAMDNPNISAIWCARGGYGAVRIVDDIDFIEFKKKPKWLIGFSDITVFHSAFHNQGIETIHGLMCVNLPADLDQVKDSLDSLKSTLFGLPQNYILEGSKHNKSGKAKGQLVGGNLTVLHTMLGSTTSIDTSGKILFIEEIGEYKYHIDRMLQSMKRAGYFDNCTGVIVGDMSRMRKNNIKWGTSVEQLILDVFKGYDLLHAGCQVTCKTCKTCESHAKVMQNCIPTCKN